MEEEIDPHVFLAIGRDMSVGHITNYNILLLEEENKRKHMEQNEKIENIEKEIEFHISQLNITKNNIDELEKKRKKIKINNTKNIKNNLERQKYYYYTITIDKLKDDQKLLESKVDALKILYKSICIN